MAAKINKLVKETSIYGLSSILGRFLNWLLVPLYTRVLINQAQFGIVTNLYSWTALLLIILTYGMETGFFRFMSKKEYDKKIIYSTSLISLASSSILFVIIGFLLLKPISNGLGYAEFPEYVGMLIAIIAMDAFCSIPFAYLRYQGRPLRFAFIRLLGIGVNIGLNLFFLIACPLIYEKAPQTISWFYRPDFGVGYIFVSNIFSSYLTFFLLIPDFIKVKFKFSKEIWKEMLSYSWPILLLGIAGVFNQSAGNLLLPIIIKDKEYALHLVGIYGACFKIAIVMVMFIQAFRYAYEPFVFAQVNEKDNRKTYARVMKYFVIFSLFVFLGVMFFLDIIKHFVEEKYFPGLAVVPIVMLGEFFFGIYFNLSMWYKITDQTRWGAYFSYMGAIITFLIIFLFTPKYGFMPCAWASFFCNLSMMLASYFIGQKKYPINYDLKSFFIYTIFAAFLYVLGMSIKLEPLALRLGLRFILLLIYIIFVIRRDIPIESIPFVKKRHRNE